MMKIRFFFNIIYRMVKVNIKKLLFVVGLSLLMSHQALALRCVNADDGATFFSENIGSIAVPQSVPDGTEIWRSENRTMRVTCWKDQGGAAENVYLYPNPYYQRLGPGIDYGIILNGNPIDMSQTKTMLPNLIPQCPLGTESGCKASYSVNFTFNYTVLIKKKGTVTGTYTGQDLRGVFQLDGVNGLNPTQNFVYTNTGLSNIRFIPCSANISISPNNIVFDTVAPFDAVAGKPAAADKNFTATVTKDCSAPFALTAQYATSTPLLDNNNLNLGNGLKLGLVNNNTGQAVDFSNVTPFADMTSVMSVTVPFTTKLTYLNASPTLGNYSAAITITVYYN
ncbi:hypothetical protein [Serratia fonticola]|jgi:hypothetical protein|uniref:hypothetical protein n=1 Tax=Serratia fonticola TaxID=47917 RepID=UPI00217B6535|nr:hypothetical protein [Serratia fonticola]CAI1708496.1 Uncharacterised protein [Serratia fonticola]CAI1725686.1 Uncharacterised protein [Serratia fonticola]